MRWAVFKWLIGVSQLCFIINLYYAEVAIATNRIELQEKGILHILHCVDDSVSIKRSASEQLIEITTKLSIVPNYDISGLYVSGEHYRENSKECMAINGFLTMNFLSIKGEFTGSVLSLILDRKSQSLTLAQGNLLLLTVACSQMQYLCPGEPRPISKYYSH